jgi:hypothetical protein
MPYSTLFGGSALHRPRCFQTVRRSLAVCKRSIYFLSSTGTLRPWNSVLSPHSTCLGYVRSIAWSTRANPRPAEWGMSDEQEDVAKAAILDKVMKGRQPADLMLRCESFLLISRMFLSDLHLS